MDDADRRRLAAMRWLAVRSALCVAYIALGLVYFSFWLQCLFIAAITGDHFRLRTTTKSLPGAWAFCVAVANMLAATSHYAIEWVVKVYTPAAPEINFGVLAPAFWIGVTLNLFALVILVWQTFVGRGRESV